MKKIISQEEFLDLVKKDKLENLTFILDLASNNAKKIKLLSKKSDTVIYYEASSALLKLNEIYNELTGNRLNLRVEDLKDYLIKVDVFSQSYFENFGLIKRDDGINIYNYFIDSQVKREAIKLTKSKKKGSFDKVMDFTKYPCLTTLLINVLNPHDEVNKLYTRDNEEVPVLEFFCNLLNFIFTSKKNASIAPVLISIKHGVGKGLLTNILQKFHGKHSARIDTNALKSEFNGILQNKALTIYDEAVADEKINNILKGLIGNQTHLARSMFADRKEEHNGNNFIITGNKSEKPVVFIEPEDRRYVPLFSKELKLEQAVEKELGISMEKFLTDIEKEEVEFFSDILCIDCDYNKSGHIQLTNKAKKLLIQENFGKTTNLIEAIKNADIKVVEDELFDKKNKSGYDALLKEIEAGYLTKPSITFIANNYDNDAFKKDLKRLGLKLWDDAFGKSQKITVNNTSFMARKLSNFDRSKIDIKKKNEFNDFDSTDFSEFDN